MCEADLSVIILTKNEEVNLESCIKSLGNIAKRVIVVDSFSTDNTVQIAKSLGADVYQHKFENYGKQFQWAIDNTNITTKWIFRFDADERLTDKSRVELKQLCVQNENTDVNGIIFTLEVTFLGKKLKHGGTYPFKKLCIFKKEYAYMEEREMDEQIILKSGKCIEMKNISEHNDFKDLSYWIHKHNWYSTRAAKDYFDHVVYGDDYSNLDFTCKARRFIKYKIYYKLPMRFRCWMYFVYRYWIRLGFLDGKEGFLYAFLQAYWYRILVDAKIYETEKLNLKR
ncbi:glycosyltransferase family 2 protein [Clostridium perfringens]|uniref:glycosyltransferase family 2 protein n=1 Tax=Clostridium perfringens TaxID=1502 RepID=UPI002468C060|nr:glycosyltransferase family 2 protein [Clostridium perfringens]MDH5092762.1 Glycosyl transferase family 2 [Clostridium perfringens]